MLSASATRPGLGLQQLCCSQICSEADIWEVPSWTRQMSRSLCERWCYRMYPALVWFGSSAGAFVWSQDNPSTSCVRVEHITPNSLTLRHLLSLGGAAVVVFSPWALSILQYLQTLSSFFFPWHCKICSLPQGIVSAGSGAPMWFWQPFITNFIISDILLKSPVPVS